MSKKLWGGRFKKGLSAKARNFSYSLSVDQVLFPYDVLLSIAHANMLAEKKIITKKEAKLLQSGLVKVFKKYDDQDLSRYHDKYEDVHSFIQAQLEKEIGAAAKKIHTARSRNDEVVTATKLYLMDSVEYIIELIEKVQEAFVKFADQNKDIVFPGLTHLQNAQPVLFAHHLLAYVEMLERDKSRFQDSLKRMDVLPLGSGSMSGTTLPIDRKFVSKQLGFQNISRNSMDAVSDRDFIAEVLADCSILFMHLSRLCEDVILWNSEQFGYLTLSDEVTTGSSLMPQKKNPDMFELCRGKTGQVYGNLTNLLVMLKGLPLSYNRDMQEDKKPLFESIYLTIQTLDLFSDIFKGAKLNTKKCLEASSSSFLYATDLLDYLVLKGVSFRDAHEIVGRSVYYAQKEGKELSDLSLQEWKQFSNKILQDVDQLFDPMNSVNAKRSFGATSYQQVKKQISFWKRKIKK